MRAHQNGFPAVLALMGLTMSAAQEKKLLRYEEIAVMLDGAHAGREGTEKIAARLGDKLKLTLIQLPDSRQPDQLSAMEWRNYLAPTPPKPSLQPSSQELLLPGHRAAAIVTEPDSNETSYSLPFESRNGDGKEL